MSKTRYSKETKRRSLLYALRAITPDRLEYWPPKLVQAFLATSKTPIPIFSFNGSLQKKKLAIKSKCTVQTNSTTATAHQPPTNQHPLHSHPSIEVPHPSTHPNQCTTAKRHKANTRTCHHALVSLSGLHNDNSSLLDVY
jgi:hypothetical protein